MRKLVGAMTAAAASLLLCSAAYADTMRPVGAELVQTFADGEEDPVSWLEYQVVNGGAEIYLPVEYKNRVTEIVIPEEIDGYKVTAIGVKGFSNCPNLVSVTLPDTLRELEASAFWGCARLGSIDIPDGVTRIGNGAFEECESLEYIPLPDSLEILGEGVFFGCTNLKAIDIPEGITDIEGMMFAYCTNLESVTLPSTLEGIYDLAFIGCKGLTSVTIPENVTYIGESAFANCTCLLYTSQSPRDRG